MVKVRAGISCPDLGLNGDDDEVARALVAAHSTGVDLAMITRERTGTVSHKGKSVSGDSVPGEAVHAPSGGDAFFGPPRPKRRVA